MTDKFQSPRLKLVLGTPVRGACRHFLYSCRGKRAVGIAYALHLDKRRVGQPSKYHRLSVLLSHL